MSVVASLLSFPKNAINGMKEIVTVQCGHKTTLYKRIHVGDASMGVTLKPNDQGKYELCQKCLAKHAIRCAWCGKILLPGNLVSITGARDGERIPQYAVMAPDAPGRYYACTSAQCGCGDPMDYQVLGLEKKTTLAMENLKC